MDFYNNKIKIGGNTYRIFEMPSVEYKGEEYLGLCDYEKTDILLSNNVSEDRMKSVLYHELTHAIFYEAGYIEHDEEMVTRLGIVMKQFIEDNFEWRDND